MQTQPLEQGVEITSALTLDELDEVKARGFNAVICNRVAGESYDFPDEASYRHKAKQLGLAWVHIPVKPGEYSQEDIQAFADSLAQLPRPILAFCRTGKRATHLWAYARRQSDQCELATLLTAAKEAGFDLEDHRQALEGQTP
ncbi:MULTISPECIES: TIGR01244 family sulfur transferase [Halomonadaceae]|uniref:TIGR01244 family phosphatase n=1 Tax=Vreelandella piezotolerans TaxID=2609667 RepID=A0ABQ6X4Q0_9GAMM|nr:MULTISPECIES: TIGR01244 family sulfur transferase [Halomonas]KAE8437008.1 TIGR01244 family phosphatase [Halomonas piezotolerans]QJA22982.1 TIGR01244 family phosphatase [Halomonas piezotolerans]